MSPLALFLFAVLLLFVAIESVGPPIQPHVTARHNGRTYSPDALARRIETDQREIAALAGAPSHNAQLLPPRARTSPTLKGHGTSLTGSRTGLPSRPR